ncbi:MAG: L,D-transpeptidase [Cyanobium sp. CZS 25K]|nr:L,D-transpeptidase [Cyanobium sp. CZS25K]
MKRPIGLALLALAWSLCGHGPEALAAAPSTQEGGAGGQLVLVRTDRQLPVTGDPIWELQLALPGQPLRAYEALVGRVRRQDADRHRLGSKAPLPRGLYAVTEITPIEPTDDVELGRFLWIGLEPDFPTARRGLGIHHDPSAGRGRSSGTDGCIGLIHGNDLLVLGDLLRRSGTRELLVKD